MRPTSTSEFPTRSGAQIEGPRVSPLTLDRQDLAALALLVASLIAVFWKVLFTSALFFYRDVYHYTYPHARFIQEACRGGTLPFWNPYLNYGEPVLANPNFLFFYPYTLLIVLLPIDFAYTMHYVAHFALAGIGAYWLARRFGQSRVAAFFAAFIFVFSGPVLSLGNFYNHAASAAWIPWTLLLTDYAVESRSVRPWLLLTLVFSLQFLAAEYFTLLASFGLSLALALHRHGRLREPLAAANKRILGYFFLVGCLMVALCAVQFFPSLDFLRNARRGAQGLPFRETATWAFHPFSLIETVLPDFFGSPFAPPLAWIPVLNWGGDPYYLSVFLGFVPLFFALAGWALSWDRRRGFVAGAALILLILSFGRSTPVFALAYLLIPPIRLVRFPVKLLVPVVLLTALLAGWGFDALRQAETSLSRGRGRMMQPLKWFVACVVLVWVGSWIAPKWVSDAGAWALVRTNEIYARVPGERLSSTQVAEATKYFLTMIRLLLPGLAGYGLGGIALLMVLERGGVWARRAVPAVAFLGLAHLVVVNYNANPTVPKEFYTYRPPVLENFQASALPYRFCTMERGSPFRDSAAGQQSFLSFDSIPEARRFSLLAQTAFRQKLLLARGSMLSRVESASVVDVERSLPPALYEFWIYVLRQMPDPARVDCLIGRTNVRYQIFTTRQRDASLREVGSIFNGSSQPSFLYENLCVTPRVYVTERADYSTSALETLTRLSGPDFNSEHEVILSAEPSAAAPSEGSGPAGRAEIVDREPNWVTIRAELLRPGYVVLLDRFDPNWRASVDGREVAVLRADHMFRAVQSGPGRHQIRFYYRQRGLRAGLWVSVSTLGLLVVLFALDPHPRRADSASLA